VPGGTNVHSTRSSQDRFARSVADKLPAIKARRGAARRRCGLHARTYVLRQGGGGGGGELATQRPRERERERETIGAHRDGVVRAR